MLTATSELAIKALIYLTVTHRETSDPVRPMAPKEMAAAIGASPSYLAKTLNLLVKAGILRSQRGVMGGVVLAKDADQITLLAIVQACQGLILSDYCDALGQRSSVEACSFHQAMFDIHETTVRAFESWTLASLTEKPGPTGRLKSNMQCKMFGVAQACNCKPAVAPKRPKAPLQPKPPKIT